MKLPGWSVAELLTAAVDDVLRSRVDCGTCPVSLSCVTSSGGNGWRFDCCGAAAIDLDGTLLILDCHRNGFERREVAADFPLCPLCSGDLTKSHVLGMTVDHRYVPTVHAAIPPGPRIKGLHDVLPEALALRAQINERLKT